MMLPTHALVGMLLALPVAAVAPEFASVALLAGFLGGMFPDLDMYVGHRKTLHFPVYYGVAAVTAVPVGLLAPAGLTVGAATFLTGAAVHCVTDVFGGGLELRPWEGRSERAVYDHHRDRWIPPRRWVDYDGSPRDLLLSLSVGIPLLVTVDGPLRWLVGVMLVVATVYTVLRRQLADLAGTLAEMLPEPIRPYVPARYR